MRKAGIAPALAALLLIVGCAQPRSARCKEICSREAECQQQTEDETPEEQSAFDEGDCVAACAALERDSKTAPNVEAQFVCMKQAELDCAKLASCR